MFQPVSIYFNVTTNFNLINLFQPISIYFNLYQIPTAIVKLLYGSFTNFNDLLYNKCIYKVPKITSSGKNLNLLIVNIINI